MNTTKSKGFVVLFAVTGIEFVSGILYIWSIVSKALIDQYHWTSFEASLPYTVLTIVFAIAMVFAGKLQDVKGPRLSATIGCSLLGIGLILTGFAKTPGVMIVTFSIIVGCGIGINNASAMPPAIKWFSPKKKGLIAGTVAAGVGASAVFYSPVFNALLNNFGIQKAFMFLGILALIIAVLLAQLLKNPPVGYIPKDSGTPVENKAASANAPKDMDWKAMIKTPNFYKLWIMFAFASSAGLMIIGHIDNITKVQANWQGGFMLVALLAIFNTLGRIFGGIFSDKIGRMNLMRIIFFLQAINMLLFTVYTSIATLAIGVIIVGLCYGAINSVFPATTADFYGLKNLGLNYGLVFTAWGLGGLIGPLAAGKIFDMTGHYNMSYILSFILLVIAGIITFTVKNKKDKQVLEPSNESIKE